MALRLPWLPHVGLAAFRVSSPLTLVRPPSPLAPNNPHPQDYHQNYFVQNPGQGYCRVVVGPKVAKFRSKFGQMLKEAA